MTGLGWLARLTAGLAGVLVALAMLVPAGAVAQTTPSVDVHSAGPLSDIWVGNELSCQVAHTGNTNSEFFPANPGVGDCGTFLAVNGTLYGPNFAEHPAGSATSFAAETPFTPVSQTFTGTGTAADPYTVTTVVTADASATVTEVDSYIVGNDSYSTSVEVRNNNPEGNLSGEVYHAGDCFLRGFDTGFGATLSGTQACTINPNNSPASALEAFIPTGPPGIPANAVETSFPQIWSDVNSSGASLPNGCDCATSEDNAMGISWPFAVGPSGANETFTFRTQIADPSISASGGQTFSGTAPFTVSGTLATISDSDTSTSPGDYTATVDWGDGTSDQNATINGSNGSFTVADSHTYASPGSHTITVTVAYTSNAANRATATDSVVVSARPPIVVPPPTPSAPTQVITGPPTVGGSSKASFDGSANPDGLPTTAFFQYGLDPKYSGGGPIVYTNSTPPQVVGADFSSHTVFTAVSGLVPNALYHVRMVATNSAGTTFGPDQTFMTRKDPPPPPPVLGRSVDVKPVSGQVFIRLPSGHTAHLGLSKGQGFIPLTEARQLPTGSQIDTRRGTIQLTAAAPQAHRTQSGDFSGGVFGFAQERHGINKGLTTLSLLEGAFPGAPSFSQCKVHKAGDPVATIASSGTLQLLHSSARGRFRTRGRYAAATVRGTVWTISDRCNGTLVSVQRHVVAVTDFVRHITILVHAGRSYLARAPHARRRG